MKKIITLALLLVTSVTIAQTKTGTYGSIRTNHYKADSFPYISSYNVVNKSGSLSLSETSIKIDTVLYTIVKTGKLVDEDEGMFTKPVTMIYATKKGMKLIDCDILLSTDKKPLEVILRRSKSTDVIYKFN